ncbi:hypothetical protein BJV82DRAFT_635645, partial [Fennellomyces sp. T-0311]
MHVSIGVAFVSFFIGTNALTLPAVGVDPNSNQVFLTCPQTPERTSVCCAQIGGTYTAGSKCAIPTGSILFDLNGDTRFTTCCEVTTRNPPTDAPVPPPPVTEPAPESPPHNCKLDEHPQDCSDNF